MTVSTAAETQRDITPAAQPPVRGRAATAVIHAPVDIYQDGEGMVLQADVAGVPKDGLTVRVDGDTLLLEGDLRVDLPQQAEPLYADVSATAYRRSFVLGREFDRDKIQAQLQDGVLRVTIPKRAELRPRKIEVQSR